VIAAVLVAIAAGLGVNRLFRQSTLAPAGHTVSPPPVEREDTSEAAPSPDVSPPSAAVLADARRVGERGERLLARGDARGAAPLLAEAARLSPQDARIANAYGRALLAIGSRDRALHQFERAARLSSGTVAYRLDLARALSDAGRRAEARREYEAVNYLEPGNAAAAAALQSPSPGTEPATVDLGGASREPVDLGGAARTATPRPAGGVFTNDDLSAGAPRPSPSIPASLRSPSPRVIIDRPSAIPSPIPSPLPY
jgi:tetratricopeptide (TPR) repeat protein